MNSSLKFPLLVFLGDLPGKDLATTSFVIRENGADVFGCKALIDAGCDPHNFPVVVILDSIEPDTTQSGSAYRIGEFSADRDRAHIEMSLEPLGTCRFDALRRSIRLGRVIGGPGDNQ